MTSIYVERNRDITRPAPRSAPGRPHKFTRGGPPPGGAEKDMRTGDTQTTRARILGDWMTQATHGPNVQQLQDVLNLEEDMPRAVDNLTELARPRDWAPEAPIPQDILQYDIYVRMSPVRTRSIRARMTSRQKAQPRFIEPEVLL